MVKGVTVTTTPTLQMQVIAKDAELQAWRDGYNALRSYLLGSKFAEDRNVNVNDVLLRLEESRHAADDASEAAYLNEIGPQIADGGHRACSHGTACTCGAQGQTMHASTCTLRRVLSTRGWHCPVCAEPLPCLGRKDTDARAAARMTAHWRADHRVEEGATHD
jgi:hypothetical protein